MIILGGGLAGCLAGLMLGQATVCEASESVNNNHKALLRFRSDNISKITGIPFKKVEARKAIFFDGQYITEPNAMLCNMYSIKVTGEVARRSIWDIGTDTRWVAPTDFHERLATMLGSRIKFGKKATSIKNGYVEFESGSTTFTKAISTIPLSTMQMLIGVDYIPKDEFKSEPISIINVKLRKIDVHQTLYFPEHDDCVYRASIIGDNMIIELVSQPSRIAAGAIACGIARKFGLDADAHIDLDTIEIGQQKFGKILPIANEALRRKTILDLTQQHGIYSLGRFACWRNVMMDDVYHDILSIRSLVEQDAYHHSLNQKG